MVASTIAMLVTPWLLHSFGYRRTYVAALVLLTIGAVVGGLAQHYPLILASRVAEGIAAGIIQPIPAVIMMSAFKPHEQGRERVALKKAQACQAQRHGACKHRQSYKHFRSHGVLTAGYSISTQCSPNAPALRSAK